MCASKVLFVKMNHPVLVLICLHLSVLAHVWSYMLYASGSRLSCQPCRRRCLLEVLVWTGKLKAQRPWTLSTGMCVLTKGLSTGLTPVFPSDFSSMRAWRLVSVCACACACVALPKLGHSFGRIEAACVQQKPSTLPFCCSHALHEHMCSVRLRMWEPKCGVDSFEGVNRPYYLFVCLFVFHLKEKLVASKTRNQQQHHQHPRCFCTVPLITLLNWSHQIHTEQIFKMTVLEWT